MCTQRVARYRCAHSVLQGTAQGHACCTVRSRGCKVRYTRVLQGMVLWCTRVLQGTVHGCCTRVVQGMEHGCLRARIARYGVRVLHTRVARYGAVVWCPLAWRHPAFEYELIRDLGHVTTLVVGEQFLAAEAYGPCRVPANASQAPQHACCKVEQAAPLILIKGDAGAYFAM